MKKFISLISCIFIIVAGTFAFTACNRPENKIQGVYYLRDISFYYETRPGFSVINNGGLEYEHIKGNKMDFSQFYIEFKNDKMIIHGSIGLGSLPLQDEFVIGPNSVHEYSYKLKVSETNNSMYDIYLDGEDYASYHFLPGRIYYSCAYSRPAGRDVRNYYKS